MISIDGLDDVWSEPDEDDDEIVMCKYSFYYIKV
jgi:hypothetical protein